MGTTVTISFTDTRLNDADLSDQDKIDIIAQMFTDNTIYDAAHVTDVVIQTSTAATTTIAA